MLEIQFYRQKMTLQYNNKEKTVYIPRTVPFRSDTVEYFTDQANFKFECETLDLWKNHKSVGWKLTWIQTPFMPK